MIKITDEILNDYLDGVLDKELVKQLESELLTSAELRKKLNALKLVHEKLYELESHKVSPGFTRDIMYKIRGRKFVAPKQQKYFIFSIASFITILCLLVFGFSISAIISNSSSANESSTVVDTVTALSDGLINLIKQLFSGAGLSIIGSIFSLIIIISGYYFFELQKRSKANLGNGHHI